MERRKFLVGMGSLAAGGAAAIGTGAVNSVRANRDLEVDVVGDGSAHLALDANEGSDFVTSDNPIGFDFSANSSGSGVNNNGTTETRPGFTILNQFDDPIYVEIDNPAADSDITDGGVDVQFIATADASGFVKNGVEGAVLFDRDETVQIVGAPGEYPSRNPASLPQKPGTTFQGGIQGSRQGNSPQNDPPMYLKIGSGASVDVIVRVVANQADSPVEINETVEFRAFDEESPTYISEGPYEFTPSVES